MTSEYHQLTLYTLVDLMNESCEHCNEGHYGEFGTRDKLHCNKCGHEVNRHKEVWP